MGVEDEVQGFCNCSHRLKAVVSGNDFFLKSGNNSNSRKIMVLCLALIVLDLDLENSQKFILELTLSIFIIDINKTFQISLVQHYFNLHHLKRQVLFLRGLSLTVGNLVGQTSFHNVDFISWLCRSWQGSWEQTR